MHNKIRAREVDEEISISPMCPLQMQMLCYAQPKVRGGASLGPV